MSEEQKISDEQVRTIFKHQLEGVTHMLGFQADMSVKEFMHHIIKGYIQMVVDPEKSMENIMGTTTFDLIIQATVEAYLSQLDRRLFNRAVEQAAFNIVKKKINNMPGGEHLAAMVLKMREAQK